jgi:RimJ/RimL family protein N-acetyltransferase
MIIGKTATLLAFDQTWLGLVQKWVNRPDVRSGTGTEGPVSDFEHRKWYERILSDRSQRVFLIGQGQGEGAVPVGLIGLKNVNQRYRSAEYWIYLGEPDARRKGLAEEATILILRFAFMGLGLNRIYLRVMQCNAPAVRLYEKVGFILEGVAREDFLLNGRFENSALYSMLSREFEEKFGRETN